MSLKGTSRAPARSTGCAAPPSHRRPCGSPPAAACPAEWRRRLRCCHRRRRLRCCHRRLRHCHRHRSLLPPPSPLPLPPPGRRWTRPGHVRRPARRARPPRPSRRLPAAARRRARRGCPLPAYVHSAAEWAMGSRCSQQLKRERKISYHACSTSATPGHSRLLGAAPPSRRPRLLSASLDEISATGAPPQRRGARAERGQPGARTRAQGDRARGEGGAGARARQASARRQLAAPPTLRRAPLALRLPR